MKDLKVVLNALTVQVRVARGGEQALLCDHQRPAMTRRQYQLTFDCTVLGRSRFSHSSLRACVH